MDPISLALMGLNLGATGYNYYEQAGLNRAEGAFGRSQAEAEKRSAENARAQYLDDLTRRKRMLAESLAARGVEDSTIAGDEMNYLNKGAERTQQGLNDRVNLANKGLSLMNKKIKSRRRGNYINLGVGLANSLGGAYGSMMNAPGVPAYSDLPMVAHP